jgi:hypothetical protein
VRENPVSPVHKDIAVEQLQDPSRILWKLKMA